MIAAVAHATARRLSQERGYSLVEVMVVVTLVGGLLAAILSTFTNFSTQVERNQRLSESQARTREGIDQLARDLRNLASPTAGQPQAVDQAAPYDLVFQTVDPSGPGSGGNVANIRRVRYCLDSPTSGQPTLWKQVQTWTTPTVPAMPSTASCPGGTWPGAASRLAVGVANRAGGRSDRPLFQYAGDPTQPTTITAITMQAWVQSPGAGKEPRLGVLRSQVFLRNQNERPVCDQQEASGGLHRLVLNASGSYDPEGYGLLYHWDDVTGGTVTSLGDGIVLNALLTAGFRDIRLTATDPAGLPCTDVAHVLVT